MDNKTSVLHLFVETSKHLVCFGFLDTFKKKKKNQKTSKHENGEESNYIT